MKKALYRKRICAEKEKLTPEKVFHTPQYRDLLTSIGHEITGGKLTTLRLYDDKNSGIAGWNQGETVAVNLGNQITSSFLTLELKSDSLIGILGHECGHYRYTDSAHRKRYAEHMLNGSWYPKEPVPENAQEKEALDAMNVYFERKDKAILSIFLQTASYLSNLLNGGLGDGCHLSLVGDTGAGLNVALLLNQDGCGGRLGDEGEGAVSIHRNDHGDDHTHVVLGALIKFLGKGGNVDTMLAQGRTDRGRRGCLACGNLQFYITSNFLCHFSSTS